MFLINFSHIFFLRSQFFWSVITSNSLTSPEKPMRRHWTPSLRQYESFSALRCVVTFTLKWISRLSCPKAEFNVFSFLLTPMSLWRFCLLDGHGDGGFKGVPSAQQWPRVEWPRPRVYKPVSLPYSTALLPDQFYCLKKDIGHQYYKVSVMNSNSISWFPFSWKPAALRSCVGCSSHARPNALEKKKKM